MAYGGGWRKALPTSQTAFHPKRDRVTSKFLPDAKFHSWMGIR